MCSLRGVQWTSPGLSSSSLPAWVSLCFFIAFGEAGEVNNIQDSLVQSTFSEDPTTVQSWNLAHEQQIRVGDRIVAVNGKRGKVEDLVQECIRARLEMELTIRPSASVIASRSRPTMASSEP
eukprot:TRINITY_DN30797_c0_g1_i2.p1 TRINITY_DN30797_c0_g1~~TRINITY_DN30797_c0_g1_i2.p1  ORF type:complete len:122 (-),score=20.19 TRINITY_DN30797_c0_g1_i2:176-541(-)